MGNAYISAFPRQRGRTVQWIFSNVNVRRKSKMADIKGKLHVLQLEKLFSWCYSVSKRVSKVFLSSFFLIRMSTTSLLHGTPYCISRCNVMHNVYWILKTRSRRQAFQVSSHFTHTWHMCRGHFDLNKLVSA